MAFGTKNVIESTYGLNVEQNVSKVLVGVDYRFNWGMAPVAARY